MFTEVGPGLPPDIADPLASLHALAQLLLCEDKVRWGSIAAPSPEDLARLLFLLHREITEGVATHLMPPG